MRTIDLPVIDAAMTLHDVVESVRESARSGAVYFARSTAPRIIRYEDVIRGIRSGRDDLQHLRFEHAWLARPPILTRTAEHAEIMDPTRSLRLFRRSSYGVGVLEAYRDVAIVTARDTSLMAALGAGPPDCFCRGPYMHPYRRPAPPTCPHDRADIECY